MTLFVLQLFNKKHPIVRDRMQFENDDDTEIYQREGASSPANMRCTSFAAGGSSPGK